MTVSKCLQIAKNVGAGPEGQDLNTRRTGEVKELALDKLGLRNDYSDALRALSRRDDPSLRTLTGVLPKVTAACSAPTADLAIDAWARAYGFCEDGKHAQLSMPGPED